MTSHAFLEYLRYRWKAQSRHGVHSPFVYDFIERVLLDKGPIAREYIVEYPSLPLHYENLISRTTAYFRYSKNLFLPQDQKNGLPQQADLLFFNESAAGEWVAFSDNYAGLLGNEGAILAVGIHETPLHTKQWRKLCDDPKVRMSIDLYGMGLLFFKKEFKEKQHFVLKH